MNDELIKREALIRRIDDVLDWEQNMGYGDGFRANLLRNCRAEIERLTTELKESRALSLKLAQDRETQDAENESLRNQNAALTKKYVPMTDEDTRKLFAMNLHNLSPEVMIQTIEEIVIRRAGLEVEEWK